MEAEVGDVELEMEVGDVELELEVSDVEISVGDNIGAGLEVSVGEETKEGEELFFSLIWIWPNRSWLCAEKVEASLAEMDPAVTCDCCGSCGCCD